MKSRNHIFLLNLNQTFISVGGDMVHGDYVQHQIIHGDLIQGHQHKHLNIENVRTVIINKTDDPSE